MTIPKNNELRPGALQILDQTEEMKLREFIKPLAELHKLTEEEVQRPYPDGSGNIFYDRISWSLSYLYMAGLVDKPKRGIYKLNSLGKEFLTKLDQLEDFVQSEVKKRDKKKKDSSHSVILNSENGTTPQENLYNSFANIKQTICDEILSTILSKTPAEFEKLVVKLLQKMGYGGEIKNSGEVTSYTNDGGIDGIVKEDVLGFGRIYIQAKRYKTDNNIGREDIQKFVGALAVAQSNKGVFISTSSFSKGAVDYALGLNGTTTLVLIDGKQLANYIYDYGLGMQVEQTIEIKKLDSDFWDTMLDEK